MSSKLVCRNGREAQDRARRCCPIYRKSEPSWNMGQVHAKTNAIEITAAFFAVVWWYEITGKMSIYVRKVMKLRKKIPGGSRDLLDVNGVVEHLSDVETDGGAGREREGKLEVRKPFLEFQSIFASKKGYCIHNEILI